MPGETAEKESGWTVDTLHAHMQVQLNALSRQLDERYATQTKAVEAALAAQQTAMQTAFTAAEKAVERQTATLNNEFHEHLVQYRHEVTLAFEASDKAISKAETATEKRFEGVNEFRAQLSDQAARLIARAEAEARFSAIIAKMEDQDLRNTERFGEMSKRLDLNQGSRAGAAQLWAIIGSGIGLMLAILGIAAFFNSR